MDSAWAYQNITTGSCEALQGRYHLPNTAFQKLYITLHATKQFLTTQQTSHFQTILVLMWIRGGSRVWKEGGHFAEVEEQKKKKKSQQYNN